MRLKVVGTTHRDRLSSFAMLRRVVLMAAIGGMALKIFATAIMWHLLY